MTVALPAPEWPARLREEGPAEDPSILLRGEATIGGTAFHLTAVRVDPIRFGPDFRPERGAKMYAGYELPALLDNISAVMEVSEAATVKLGTGEYVLWILPHAATT